jgi:hypothetical protein
MTKVLRMIPRALTLALVTASLAACVYAPPPPAPGYGYAPGYYAAPGYYYPPVVGSVNLGFGYWGGGGHRYWR